MAFTLSSHKNNDMKCIHNAVSVNEMTFLFAVSYCVETKGRGIHNNMRLLYFGSALTELSIIMAVPKFSNSFSFNGKILTKSDFLHCNEFMLAL